MRVHRAHDGRTIEVRQALSQFQNVSDLCHAISLATAIPSDSLICMDTNGALLSEDVLDRLALEESSAPVEFFVFNQEYLSADVQETSRELYEEAELCPPLEPIDFPSAPTPRSLDAIVAWSQTLYESVQSHASTSQHHYSALETIQRSTALALLNLVSYSSVVQGLENSVRERALDSMNAMRALLQSYQSDHEILALVTVNPRMLPRSGSGATRRTLGDFVSRPRMGIVAEECASIYQELEGRWGELQQCSQDLKGDTADLEQEVGTSSLDPSTETLEEAWRAETRMQELVTFIKDICSPDANGWPVADRLDRETVQGVHAAIDELKVIDDTVRECVRRLTADKNDFTARSLAILAEISSVQAEFADMGAAWSAFETDSLTARGDKFRHIARLNKMLLAYATTMAEIVRRGEFNKHFLTKSRAVAEMMAKMSSRERKKRGQHKTEVAGQLPWEVQGMDEQPTTLEISTIPANGKAIEMDRSDLTGLLALIEDIQKTMAEADAINGDSSGESLVHVKATIQDLVAKFEEMDEDFALLVEQTLLGDDDVEDDDEADSEGTIASENGLRKTSRRRLGALEADRLLQAARQENEKLHKEMHELLQEAEKHERADHDAHVAELTMLRTETSNGRAELRSIREQLDTALQERSAMQVQLAALQGDIDTERERRINMQDELTNLRAEAQNARKEAAEARRDASEEAERLAEADTHLHDLQAELEESKAARIDATTRIENLLSEGSNVEKELSAAQERIAELTEQLEHARQESRGLRDALTESEAGKERFLRSHRAEADGDRAILEESLRSRQDENTTLKAELEHLRKTSTAETDAVSTLRGQLRGADEAHEQLVKAMESAKDASHESEMARRHSERENEQLLELARSLMDKLLHLRSHVRALPILSASRSSSIGTTAVSEEKSLHQSVGQQEEEERKQAILDAYLAAPGEVESSLILDALRIVSPEEISEEVSKKLDALVTLVRKWQKTYKRHTNEAAQRLVSATRERIAFRNFQVGDLALFLPSRNNLLSPKPWAAFNISFPHYFLNAPGGSGLAEELRSKEWIVARITKIAELISGPTAAVNPFQLPDGTKYCLLDVDGWDPAATPISPARPALHTRTTSASIQDESIVVETPTQRKPEDAEVPRQATQSLEIAQLEPPPVTSITPATAPTAPTSAAADPVAIGQPATVGPSQPVSTQNAPPSGGKTEAVAPSALSRAIQAANSRPSSRPASMVRALHESDVQRDTRPQAQNGLTQSSHQEGVPGAISIEGTTANPAFGVRARRRGLRNHLTPGVTASTATSPGTTSTSNVNGASEVDPFSQSLGGTFGTSLAHRMSTLAVNGDDAKEGGVAPASTLGGRKSSQTGSVVQPLVSPSPTPGFIGIPVPARAQADATHARGITILSTSSGRHRPASEIGNGSAATGSTGDGSSGVGISGRSPSNGATQASLALSLSAGKRSGGQGSLLSRTFGSMRGSRGGIPGSFPGPAAAGSTPDPFEADEGAEPSSSAAPRDGSANANVNANVSASASARLRRLHSSPGAGER